VKLAYAVWLVVWATAYALHNGWQNFFWLCDLANFVVGLALWLESPLLWSSQAVGVLLVQVLWTVDFLVALLFGVHPIGGTEYMFNSAEPLWLRGLSLFHMAMPPLLLWGLRRLGYDRRGWRLQTAITWALLPATFLLTDPAHNINWLWRPFGVEQRWLPPAAFLLVAMAAYPLLLYLPTHLLLRLWGRRLPS
jgi:hypothetical protein